MKFDHYISDTHFGHYNVILYANRPYGFFKLDKITYLPNFLKKYFKKKANKVMTRKMISNWNSKVKEGETVLHCGDFAYLNINQMKKVVSQLNGDIYLVKGNHDKRKDSIFLEIGFKKVYKRLEIPYKDIKVIFSHYPYVHDSLRREAIRRTTLLKPFKESVPETKLILHNLKNLPYEKKRDFLHKVSSFNVKDKKVRSYILRIISMFIGTREVNDCNILVHGHSHNPEVMNKNAINLCVEAHNFTPISHSELEVFFEKAYKYLFTDSPEDLSELISLRENLRQRFLLEKKTDLGLKIKERLSQLDYEINYKFSEQEIMKGNTKLTCIPQRIDRKFIDLQKLNKTYIPVEDLIVGSMYEGECRNSNYAIWDGSEFVYLRTKFGDQFLDKVSEIESFCEYDIFIPHLEIDKYCNETTKKLYDMFTLEQSL